MPDKQPRKVGCENCRARHVKCEGDSPCSRCKKKGLDCNRVPRAQFRQASITGYSEVEFPAEQIWCNTSERKLEFIDQTLETSRFYHDGTETGGRIGSSSSPTPPSVPQEQECGSLHTSIASDSGFINNDAETNEEPDYARTFTSYAEAHSFMTPSGESFSNTKDYTDDGDDGDNQPLASLDHPVDPGRPEARRICFNSFGSLNEDAVLRETLRSFVDFIGPAVDPSDSHARLAVQITERALNHSWLVPKVLYLGEMRQPNAAATPQLNTDENESASDGIDALLSTYLLRLIDNVKEIPNSAGTLNQKSILSALESLKSYSEGDRQFACRMIWASIRQELFIIILNHEETSLDLDLETLRNLQDMSDDDEWISRIFMQLINSVHYCFGDSKNSDVYDQLVEDLALWEQSKPTWLKPLLFQPPQAGQVFPEIWMINDIAAVASQYYHLVRILLTAHNPRMPRLGPARRAAAEWRDDQVKSDVMAVCDIATSRDSVDPMHICACMAIALAGDLFTDSLERASALEILVKTQERYGLSTRRAQSCLKDSWKTP